MKLRELIEAARVRAADTAKPQLWSDDEWTLFLNEAENEAAERGQLILDIDTPEVVEIPVSVGVRTYPLHPSILKIQRAKLDLGTRPLAETSTEQMDAGGVGWFPAGLASYPGGATWYPGGSNWETLSGTPERYIRNAQSITLIRIPDVADTLRLIVTRLPLAPMCKENDSPEIASQYHFRMIDWALHCAYIKQDAETFDPKKAIDYEAAFIRSFGMRPDANVQRKRHVGGPRTVQMGVW